MAQIKRKKSLDKFSYDKKISIALMSSFVILTLQYFILILFNLLGTEYSSRIQLLSKIIVGFAFVYVLPTVLKRNKIKFFVVYGISIFVFIINYLFFPQNREYIKDLLFPFFLTCLPTFIYSLSMYDLGIFKYIMKKAGFIVFLIGTIIGILIFSGRASVGKYSMSLSYYMLLPAVLYLDELTDKISLKNSLYFLISLIIIIALGSRGAVLCIGVFLLLKLIIKQKSLNNTTVIVNIIIYSIIAFSYIFVDDILGYLYDLLLKFGISSRSIELFLQDGIHWSGRDTIYANVIEAISNHPIIGLGIAGDRVIDGGGGYVHNIFIEILANYGIIVGSIIIVCLIFLIIRCLLSKNNEQCYMIIIWIGIGFIPLLVSGSYLIEMKFWLLMGLIFKTTYKEHNNNYN